RVSWVFRGLVDTRPSEWPQAHCSRHVPVRAGARRLPAPLLFPAIFPLVGGRACPPSHSPFRRDFSLDVLRENFESRNLFDTQFPPCKNRGRGIFLQGGLARRETQSLAEVAELADAHGSGPCPRTGVWGRVPSSAR